MSYQPGMKRAGGPTETAMDAKRRLSASGAGIVTVKPGMGGLATVGGGNAATADAAASSRPLDKAHCDAIVNCLLRLACQVTHFLI